MKAVIPVAGLGTRMLPMTKAIPKEMLPIVDIPLIQYVINEVILAGIKEIILVISPGRNLIENYFGGSPDLESILEKGLKLDLLHKIRSLLPNDVKLIYAYQEEAKGLGHAILCARSYIGDEPFAVLLPDVLVNQYESNLAVDNLAFMISRYEKEQVSLVMVERVPPYLVSKYGIVDCSINNSLMPGETARIYNLIEKPDINDAPSNLAIVGRYVFSAKILSILEKIQPGVANEIQLTDAMTEFVKHETLAAYHLVGLSHDCGDKAGYVLANIHYALRHAEIAETISKNIKQFNLLV